MAVGTRSSPRIVFRPDLQQGFLVPLEKKAIGLVLILRSGVVIVVVVMNLSWRMRITWLESLDSRQ